jgi:transcriptional regulator with XRE-family HTH domain
MIQKTLAGKANISVSGLSRIERGLASPVYSTLEKLTDALEIQLSELFNAAEDDEASRPQLSRAPGNRPA